MRLSPTPLAALVLAASAFAACGHQANDVGEDQDDGAQPITPKAGAGVRASAEPPSLNVGINGILSRGTPVLDHVLGSAATAAAPRLTWHGGKIVASAKVFNMFWGDSFNGAEADERVHYDAFLKALDGNWDFVKPLNQYGISPVAFLGSQVYSPNPPATLDDKDIRATVVWAIVNGYAPQPDASTIYQVFLPAGTNLTKANGSESMCKNFCGYHGSFDDARVNGGAAIRYVALPRPDCGGCTYAVTVQDRETVISSHELSEVVTDADVNNHTLGWYDDLNGEIGDICATAPTSTIKGFAVQAEWSNADNACVPPHDPTPDFGVGLAPTAVQVQRGATVQVKVWASPVSGYTGNTTFEAQSPVGLDVSLPYPSLAANTFQLATISAHEALVTGQYSVTFTLTDGKLSHSGVLLVQVVEAPKPHTAFSADAEHGLSQWQTSASSGQQWRIELSQASRSGTHRFRSNVGQGYSANTASFLISPPFSLSGSSSASLSFAYKAQLEQGYDWFSVYATSDNGAHWTRLKDLTGQSEGFPYWAEAALSLDLTAFAGKPAVRIAFGLQTDGSVQGWGVALDDIEVIAR